MASNYWIQTFVGKRYDLIEPTPEMVCIEDIAHALSNLCRFTGHTKRFYSVAEHCVLVSRNVPPEDALAGLMHDAAEAYTGDINRPLKQAMRHLSTNLQTAPLDVLEARAEHAIKLRFGLNRLKPQSVTEADMRALVTEAHELLIGGPQGDWQQTEAMYPRFHGVVLGKSPVVAEVEFLMRFEELAAARGEFPEVAHD